MQRTSMERSMTENFVVCTCTGLILICWAGQVAHAYKTSILGEHSRKTSQIQAFLGKLAT